jgi:hypothetical protein
MVVDYLTKLISVGQPNRDAQSKSAGTRTNLFANEFRLKVV